MEKSPLESGVQYIKGVGPERAKLFLKLGITTVESLLYYFPREWVDRSNILPIIKASPGQPATVSGVVISSETRQVRGALKITSITIKDKSGFITGTWFNQPFMEKKLPRGTFVMFHGKVETYRGMLQIGNPEYEIADESDEVPDSAINVNRIVPIYPLTEKLSQKQFRSIIKFAVDNYMDNLNEYMPSEIKSLYNLIDIKTAVYNAHFPQDFKTLEESKRRIIFDEFFFMQLAFAVRKKKVKEKPGILFGAQNVHYKLFEASLPFSLTGAQKRVIEEIRGDFTSGKPMNRLIQGDVGSGKTIVAVASAVMAADNGCQSAIMAPTEILASQHMKNISALIASSKLTAVMLLGGMRKKERMAALELIRDGAAQIVIGTHALIQEDVVFKNLGLAIIDEQHRFGVMQRAQLMKKGTTTPHSLIMTATPIPRTLSLSVYGDTDISVIDELPPGRKPIRTIVFESWQTIKLYSFLEERLKEKSQIYMVYPLVEESDKLDLKSAIEMEKHITARFKEYKTSIIHGQMNKEERDMAMDKFRNKEIDILVATTVIEVGVDVPDASVMVIEHAERFGLSQLHQLRGRVGRGSKQSYCVLVGDPKTEDGMKRLGIMAETQDGFKISEADLEIRGPGEFMGTRQHGLPEFRMANIIRDKQILELAKEAAFYFISADNGSNNSKKEELIHIIKQKYGSNFDLINIG
jgi:ATP-dependent DNA helicase RecG